MTDAELEIYETYEAKCKAVAIRRAEMLPHNKGILFAALAAAEITLVTAEFDGSGDSGQLDEPVGFNATNTVVAIPKADITIKTVDFESGAVNEESTSVRGFIEILAYEFLHDTHSGWENNDGAYGEFRFDGTDHTVTLEYNERYVETHYHEHEF